MDTAVAERIESLDKPAIREQLNQVGYAKIPAVLQARECDELIAMYAEERCYRKTINMKRHNFGIGEYKYFAAPLPPLVNNLRTSLYPLLAETANEWLQLTGKDGQYPPELSEYLKICHRHGQTEPTPLILRYEAGGYNCLHQDLYGTVAFPFQVVFVLNQREVDYTGGEFLLVEQRPRAQSRGHVVTPERGDGLIFPTRQRPVAGTRGYYQTTIRHGVSTITAGVRYSLGIIFHEA